MQAFLLSRAQFHSHTTPDILTSKLHLWTDIVSKEISEADARFKLQRHRDRTRVVQYVGIDEEKQIGDDVA